MQDAVTDLLELYGQHGLFKNNHATYAPTACSQAGQCWKHEPQDRFPDPPPSGKGEIYRPWIGPKYATTRMVVIGENFNDHGGFDEAENLISWAIPRLAQGKVRMNFDSEDYTGSIVFHRAAVYAQAWLFAEGHGEIPLGEVYNHIAFTNHVKCSPRATSVTRSTPNTTMWSTCGRTLLAQELQILKAQRIVVLGTGSNWGTFSSHVWTDLQPVRSIGRAGLFAAPDGRAALVVRHPAARGGPAHAIADDVRAVLRTTQNPSL